MPRVQDKVVFITGGASGVGRACATLLAGEGARVVIADLDAQGGQAVAGEVGLERALFVRMDISSEEEWASAMRSALERFGRIDALVNCAAILPMESIEDATLAQWQRTLRVNADGAFLGCQQAIATMKASGGGSIVNLASTAALAGFQGMCAYAASKGAVTALTRNVAAHCRAKGYRIRCNSIHPAGIRTPMTETIFAGADPSLLDFDSNPASGVCEPVDVANMVLYLVSDESRFVNGAELRLDNALLIAIG
ncbi:MAG TPA: SDR family oxidoreductase [Burkholderiaceae bacterium]|nr:SDR family oxidoreductase [Burkholderiaceae bacterium]